MRNAGKKLSLLLMCSALILSSAGCSTKKEGGNSGEITTLTWLLPGDQQSDIQSVIDEVNKITEKEIGADIDMKFIDQGSFSEKMKLNMASNTPFDICFTGYVNNYQSAVNSGGLMDITDMIDKVDGLRDILPDYAWDAAEIDGRIYGVPNMQIYATANALVTYDDISSKYDFDWSKVSHIDDIEPYLEMVKNGEKDIYAYRPNYGIIPWYSPKYEAFVSEYLAFPKGSTSADDLKYMLDVPEYIHGAEQLWSWYQRGYIRQDALSIGDDTADYQNGKYAITNMVWKPGAETAEKITTKRENKYINITKPYLTKGGATATMAAVGVNSKNPEKALEFIKLINTNKELYNLVCFGIEGKHYNLDSTGRVISIEKSGYDNQGNAWKFGNTFNALLTEGQEDNVWEETKRVNEEAEKSELLGFCFDNTKVKTQISSISAIRGEYEVINRGVKDPHTYLDELKGKLKEAGIEQVYDEYKRQLDEYFKSRK